MTYAMRSTAGAAAFAALLAAVNLLFDAGVDKSCSRWDRGPGPRVAAAERRCRRAEEVARAAADGRLTLLEAAASFRDLRGEVPDGNPDAYDDEYYCREAIQQASRVLDDPVRAEEVAARLSAELEAHMSRGTLRLRPAGG
jgi:hypothetical protein